jgi:hypothetical protein
LKSGIIVIALRDPSAHTRSNGNNELTSLMTTTNTALFYFSGTKGISGDLTDDVGR